MSRTRRTIPHYMLRPTLMDLTWRGLGDMEPFIVEKPRHASVHGFDGANRMSRHPNTSKRVKRSTGKARRRSRNLLR